MASSVAMILAVTGVERRTVDLRVKNTTVSTANAIAPTTANVIISRWVLGLSRTRAGKRSRAVPSRVTAAPYGKQCRTLGSVGH